MGCYALRMADFRVGLLQVSAGQDLEANLSIGEAACRRAHDMGADVALFPEMWSTGYRFEGREGLGNVWRARGRWPEGEQGISEADLAALEAWRADVIPADGAFVRHFRVLARELGMAIAITYLEATAAGPRNSVSLLDRHGEVVLTYAKVHTCAFDLPEAALVPGEAFHVATLDTAGGPVRVGAMICYDREFPESARVLMLQGAEVILTPNACTLDDWRLAQFSTRAVENAVGVAMTNYPGPIQNGQSCAYHPMLFQPGAETAADNLVVRAGEDEEILVAAFDMDALRDYRRRETFGNAFRRPSRYGPLVSAEIADEFVRVDAAGRVYERDGEGSSLP